MVQSVAQWPLEPLILVRVQVRQPILPDVFQTETWEYFFLAFVQPCGVTRHTNTELVTSRFKGDFQSKEDYFFGTAASPSAIRRLALVRKSFEVFLSRASNSVSRTFRTTTRLGLIRTSPPTLTHYPGRF
jgi:hypothetical protein